MFLLPFSSPMHESEVAQSCLTLSDPIYYSLSGSSIHGIFQARVLEWGAIAFSEVHWYEWGVKVSYYYCVTVNFSFYVCSACVMY